MKLTNYQGRDTIRAMHTVCSRFASEKLQNTFRQSHKHAKGGTGVFCGFALPSIMIASVVMLALLATAISSVTSTRTALRSQHYEQLAREAAESGMTVATACLQSGVNTWPHH